MIESRFDDQGISYYLVTFPDGNRAYCSSCWQADLLSKRWDNGLYAINYRGENLGKISSDLQAACR